MLLPCLPLLSSLGLIFFNRFSQADDLSQFTEKMLKNHNEFRKRHHSPPLQSSAALNKVAQDYAQHLADIDRMIHSGGKYGENLYMSIGGNVNNVMEIQPDPVESWYNEISYYPGGSFHDWGHFTQVIWKNSKYLGCGVATKGRKLYVVCNYDPPGNVEGQYDENVLTIHGGPWPSGSSELGYLIVLGLLILAVIFGVFVVYGRGAFHI